MTNTPATTKEYLDSVLSGVGELLNASDVEIKPYRQAIIEIDSRVWNIIAELGETHHREMRLVAENLDVMEEEIIAQDNTTKSEETT